MSAEYRKNDAGCEIEIDISQIYYELYKQYT